jgi:hypothetical protein
MSNSDLEHQRQLQDTLVSIKAVLDDYSRDSAGRYVDINSTAMSQLIGVLEPLVNDRFWVVKRSGKTQGLLTSILDACIACQNNGWECRSLAEMYIQWLESSLLACEKGIPGLAAIAFGLEK